MGKFSFFFFFFYEYMSVVSFSFSLPLVVYKISPFLIFFRYALGTKWNFAWSRCFKEQLFPSKIKMCGRNSMYRCFFFSFKIYRYYVLCDILTAHVPTSFWNKTIIYILLYSINLRILFSFILNWRVSSIFSTLHTSR